MNEVVAAQAAWFVPQLMQLLHSPAAALLPALPVLSFMSASVEDEEEEPPWAGPLGADEVVAKPKVVPTVAITDTDFRAARSLVERRYAWRGYRRVGAESDDTAHRRELTLLAWSGGSAAVGTITLRFDSGMGLRADRGFAESMQAIRSNGRVVCEFTRFAVSADADSKATVAELFDLSYVLGRKMIGVTDVVAEVNPRHAGFYRRAFGFEQASEVRHCERVDAPAILMRLDADELERRMWAAGVPTPGRLTHVRAEGRLD